MTAEPYGGSTEPRERRRRSSTAKTTRMMMIDSHHEEEEDDHKDRSSWRAFWRYVWSLFEPLRRNWCSVRIPLGCPRRHPGNVNGVEDFSATMRISLRKPMALPLVLKCQKSKIPWRLLILFCGSLIGSISCVMMMMATAITTNTDRVTVHLAERIIISVPEGDSKWGKGRTEFFRMPTSNLAGATSAADHGGLDIKPLSRHDFSRKVHPQDPQRLEDFRASLLTEELNQQRVSYVYWLEDELVDLHFTCRRPNWVKMAHPNCNYFQEMDLGRDYNQAAARRLGDSENEFDNYYVSRGFYRDVWVNVRPPDPARSILKTTRMNFDFDYHSLHSVRREALVMERLSAYSQIIDIYGYCGTSVAVEPVPHEVEQYVIPGSGYRKEEQGGSDELLSMNDFTPKEKLQMALEMAESIAVLHGYQGGVIVHDDIQLQQWLRAEDGTLKLGDFNRASIMDWDAKEQQYCKYGNGEAFGNYRSPEEFAASDLDEKIDVYSFGNNIYGLLTGLWVFYTNADDSVVQQRILAGEKPFVDTRFRTSASVEERRLVEIMERCWEKKPADRIDIFTAVRMLRWAKEEVKSGS